MKKNYAFRFYEEKQICSRKWLGEGGTRGEGGASCPPFLYGSEGDVKKFLLATSDSGEEIQGELDLFATKNRLNEVSFRRRLDTISKNIIRNKNLRLGDLEIRSRLKKLFEKNEFFNRGYGGGSNKVDEFLTNNDFNFDFSGGYVPPVPDPPPIRGITRIFLPKRTIDS